MKARRLPRSTTCSSAGTDRGPVHPACRSPKSSPLGREAPPVDASADGAAGPARSSDDHGTKNSRRIRPPLDGRPANDATSIPARCDGVGRARATIAAATARQEHGADGAHAATELCPIGSNAKRLDRSQPKSDADDATLTFEEKNFLDYLVKQALRCVLETDAASQPDITRHKDET
jgi:hypothetical protein